jgi:thiamine biosynthesis lipoprotein
MISKYAGIKPVRATDDVIYVIDLALSVSKQTEGVFDITFKPLGYLWNVKDIKKPPEYAEIQKALGLIDYRDVVVDKDNKTIFLKRLGMSIGLDGIAKGYAAGKAAKKMEEHGIHNFIINAGGDLYYSGKKNRKYWTCGIRNPDSKDDSIVKKFEIRSNCAVATSGDYEKFFVFEGVRYHHIIDPRTGYPGVGVRSVTVFSEDPALADAYATSFFLLGYEKSLKITNEKQDVAFVMIDKDGKILKSNNISRFAEDITGH